MADDKREQNENQYWVCVIGPVSKSELPQGADSPPRSAAQDAVIEMIGRQPECWSGWGTSQERFERIQRVWNSETPDDAGHAALAAARSEWKAIETGLPEKDGWYACTINDNDGFENLVEPYWFDAATGIWSDGDNLSADAIVLNGQSVIAYMPLPQPYQRPSSEGHLCKCCEKPCDCSSDLPCSGCVACQNDPTLELRGNK